ncbi:hypothetical protein [Arthrobacter sp. 7Tela_A1]|uniref:hypothetical protein n=1 Tax=Arthrobacter sp. 7Tela_A1 TaxID=3093745 RepID=UPI003BB5228F
MMRDEQTDALLRSLDPAASGAPVDRLRAHRDLERILTAEPDAYRAAAGPARPDPRARKVRRRVLVGAAAAVTLGLVALPALGGGDPAFATWTNVPAVLSPADAERAAEACRSSDRNTPEESMRSQVAIAEQRGDWTTVILSGQDGFSVMCVSDGSLFGGAFGYSGQRPDATEPEPRGLLPISMGMGSTRSGDLSMVVGAAGADVVGVSYTSQTEGEVVGSVANGYFVVWFPGDELRDYPADGVELSVEYTDGSSTSVAASLEWANS